ncbi:MAG: PQQ-like beta-propeller repeat protein, partial [Gemmataceae bacterium]|nr:PQQ-like beta-propeller repeat protein [Gemmataceae bacterium]
MGGRANRWDWVTVFLIIAVVIGGLVSFGFAADWYQFRGPTADGQAGMARLPLTWSRTENIVWRQEIPGKGWSSPVVAQGRIYLTTAVPKGTNEDQSLRALCLDGTTGKVLWDVEVFHQDGSTAPRIHAKNSHASPTPVVDNDQLFVHFGHMGTACLDARTGQRLWAQQGLRYQPVHGNGGSPVLVGQHLIYCMDGADVQQVVALDRRTGAIAWRTPRQVRAKKPFSFCTPTLITVNGRSQVICPGSDVVMALDPATGKELWRVRYDGYSVVPRPVFAHGLVFVSSGYDVPVLYAIRPDGRGDVTHTHVAWMTRKGVPRNASPLVVGDYLYLAADDGLVSCLEARTGRLVWSERLGRAFSASPIHAAGRVYFFDEEGVTVVQKS